MKRLLATSLFVTAFFATHPTPAQVADAPDGLVANIPANAAPTQPPAQD